MNARSWFIALFATSAFAHIGVADDPKPAAKPQPTEREQLLKQAQEHRTKKEWDQTLVALEKVLAIDRKGGEVTESVAGTLTLAANVHERKSDWPAAVKAWGDVLKQWEQLKGKNHWRAGEARVRVDEAKRMEKCTEEQKSSWRKGMEAYDRAEGLEIERKFQEALDSAKLAQAGVNDVLGSGAYFLMHILDLNGRCHYYLRDIDAAMRSFEQSLAIRRKTLPSDHPEIATGLNNQGAVYYSLRDFTAALRCYDEALAIRRRALPAVHVDIAVTLNNLGAIHGELRDYAAARDCHEESLGILRKALPVGHADIAAGLNNLGVIHIHLRDFAAARRCFEEALGIRRNALPAGHVGIAMTLTNLGNVLNELREFAAALRCHEEALGINRKALPADHPDIATSLNDLGAVHHTLRDYAAAKRCREEALGIYRKALPANHPDIALGLSNLGAAHDSLREYSAAQRCHEEALGIYRKALPANHPDIANCLNQLGAVHEIVRDYAAAQRCHEEALGIYRKAWPADHPDIAWSLNNLGKVHYNLRDYAAAERSYDEALGIRRKALPADHPYIALSLSNMGLLALRQGNAPKGFTYFASAVPINRANLNRMATAQDEVSQITAAAGDGVWLGYFVSVGIGHANEVHGAVLDWKGQVTARQRWQRLVQRLNPDPRIAQLIADLTTANEQMIQAAGRGQQAKSDEDRRRAQLALAQRASELEADLGQRSPEFRRMLEQRTHGINSAQVAASLPSDSALVDYLVYEHHWFDEGEEKTEQRVIAFVLRPGRAVQQVYLGPTKSMENPVSDWRKNYGTNASELLKLLWEPIEKYLDGVKLVLVSPDGFLNGLPFAAIPGKEPGKFLLHEYAFATIAIPSQLPELLAAKDDKTANSFLLAGDIDFGNGEPGASATGAPVADAPGSPKTIYRSLPGTKKELESLQECFVKSNPGKKCDVVRETQATKAAFVKAAPSSRYIHLATHGYFADPSVKNALAPSDRLFTRGFNERMPVEGLHPGLLSGLVFAGANNGKPEDTRLTALEVADMNLNADLVVLSACETGLGKVAGGEGVLGLQRAFQVAGAKSVLSTLWKVDDDATQLLIREFYHNLWVKKLSKVESLRQAQLRLLSEGKFTPGTERALGTPGDGRNSDRKSPYYWAGFVLSGDWR